MPRRSPAARALARSRDAMAVTSQSLARCVAGITFSVAIRATPSTPQRIFRDISAADSTARRAGVCLVVGQAPHRNACMRVLLFSMPDSFEHTPTLAMRMPNGALASLAGNAGPGHRVAVADLILAQHAVVATVERLMRDHDPDVVGLSVMTFQRRTALRL